MNSVQICFPQHIFLHQLFSMQTVCSCCIYLYHSPLLQLFKTLWHWQSKSTRFVRTCDLAHVIFTTSNCEWTMQSQNCWQWEWECGGQVENAEVRKPKYANQSTETEVQKPNEVRKSEKSCLSVPSALLTREHVCWDLVAKRWLSAMWEPDLRL